jgi:hypothetical protein
MVSTDEKTYKCYVCCKVIEQNNVIVYRLGTPINKINFRRNIAFNDSDDVEKMKVKISEDFQKVVLTHKSENYILTRDRGDVPEDDDGYCQFMLTSLKGKNVQRIISSKNEFFFVCHDEFDYEVDILSSTYEDFKISIPRQIEPESFHILDCIMLDAGNSGFGKIL